jgi:hypothetical protein
MDDSNDNNEPLNRDHLWGKGVSGNPKGRPKKNKIDDTQISEDDRDYYGYDSRKFLERALLRATTWEEGLKYAKELRMLQHPSLQAIQTRTDTTHTITLRWSTSEELSSNQQVIEHEEKTEKQE